MNEPDPLDYLLSAEAVRQRGEEMLAWALQGHTQFDVNLDKIEAVAREVLEVMEERFPDGNIPFHSRWSHFQGGDFDRLADLDKVLDRYPTDEQTRSRVDLAIISVLLDAGSGPEWSYLDEGTGCSLVRSEGLAVASLRMFLDGMFSAHRPDPCRVDAARLLELTLEDLARGFQVSAANPIVGLEGRLELLHRLGRSLRDGAIGFPEPRPGTLFDACSQGLGPSGTIPATGLLRAVLIGLGEVWPSRLSWEDEPLGDVWLYEAFGRPDDDAAFIPFHKLSQWLTYSLVEPFQEGGVGISDLDGLTGLAEYRNGGLFIDRGVLQLKDPEVVVEEHEMGSELVVEWRSLTVALLDRVAAEVRHQSGQSLEELPLIKVLEGGTWWAGRRAAAELREGATPPIRVVSDGTVF